MVQFSCNWAFDRTGGNFRKVIGTREVLMSELAELGAVVPLRDRQILLGWFSTPEVSEYLRVAVGTDSEAMALMKAAAKFFA